MIRLSLPTYDPTQPLVFTFTFQTRTDGSLPPATPVPSPFAVAMYADPFVGWVILDAAGYPGGGPAGLLEFSTNLVVEHPAAHGLTGGEGWFTFQARGRVFVTDCVVQYTPLEPNGGGRSEGYFS